MRVLSGAEVNAAAAMREVIEVVRLAYAEYSAGSATVPLRIAVGTENGGTTLFMPGYSPQAAATVVKLASLFPSNAALGLPVMSALVVLSDGTTGLPLAVMEGMSVTSLRTGAASAVGADLMARADATVAAIIGTGAQGRTQLLGLAEVRRLAEVRVYDVDRTRAEAFAAEMAAVTGLTIRATATSDEAVDGADIVNCATTSRTPVFNGARLAPGTHVNGAGSYMPQMQEVDEQTLLRATKIIVDSREAALAEAGDLLVPIGKGLIDSTSVYAEIGEIVAGAKPGRQTTEEITFFKHVGIALLDAVTARLIYERAQAEGLGLETNRI